jgi:signal transduction histidine kinase
LRQAIRNVLNNAIKYTPSGGKVLCEGLETMESTIPTSADLKETQGTQGPDGQAACETRWISLRIRDNGPGIHEDDVRHLFTRFYRADSQKEIPGTGLGLSIARELVELHGGHLTVTSTPGEGSTFTIYLPPTGGKHDKDERS